MARMLYGVYANEAVRVSGNGSSATLVGAADLAYPDFDEAYAAAQAMGGDRWVIGRGGDSEYVPVVQS